MSAGPALVSMPLLPAAVSAAIPAEWLGWAAAGLTLATFICCDMRRLRLLALAANAAFIAYGAVAQLLPVLMLHLALVPVNLWRLNEAFRAQPRPPALPWRETFAPGRPVRRRRPRSWRASFRAAQAIVADGQPAPAIFADGQPAPAIDADGQPARAAGAPSTDANASATTLFAATSVRPSARSASKAASPSVARTAASAVAAACDSSACLASFSRS